MNRRDFLKSSTLSILTLAAITMGCSTQSTAPTQAAAQVNNEGASQPMKITDKKVLIAYFSWSGNTKAIADTIHKNVGGDIFEIVPETPYSQNYQAVVDKAEQEQKTNARPSIKNKPSDISQYDIVFLGYPNWWGSMPMPVATFLESYNWQGKTIVPFFTHGGGGVQNCQRDLEKLSSGAIFKDYLCLSGNRAKNSQSEITNWLNKLTF